MKLDEMFGSYKDAVEQQFEDKEWIASQNLSAVEKYENAKKWGKSSARDALVAKYKDNGGMIRDQGYYYRLGVVDIKGLPLCVNECPLVSIDYKAPIHYRIGGEWSGTICDNGDVSVKAVKTDRLDATDELLQFLKMNGIVVSKAVIMEHLAAVVLGHKVQTKLGDGWSVFSPIRDNGIIMRFSRDGGESYIA